MRTYNGDSKPQDGALAQIDDFAIFATIISFEGEQEKPPGKIGFIFLNVLNVLATKLRNSVEAVFT